MSAPGTEKQIAFAKAYVENGGNATKAALEAGYSADSAKDMGSRTLATPFVQLQIMEHLRKQKARAGVIGFKALCAVAESETAPPAARVAAGRTLVEISGMLDGAQASGGAGAFGASESYQAILDRIAGVFAAQRQSSERLQ